MKCLKLTLLFVFFCGFCSVTFAQDGGSLKEKTPSYRGFVDGGYLLGLGDWGRNSVLLMTSHGCQINEYLYFGAGAGLSYRLKNDKITGDRGFVIPLFVNPRLNLSPTKVSPFVDVKLGYSVGDEKGLFFNPGVGVRVASGDGVSLTFGVSYLMQKTEVTEAPSFWGPGSNAKTSKVDIGGIAFKMGVEF